MFLAKDVKTKKRYLAQEAIHHFINPLKRKWVCLSCEEKVVLKKEYKRKHPNKLERIIVRSHFSHFPDSSCSVGESVKHRERKLSVLNQLYGPKTFFEWNDLKFLVPKDNIKGKEKTRGLNRADVLVEFEKFNGLFGKGIVIEIVCSEDDISMENKALNWLEKGYSVTFLDSSFFDGNVFNDFVVPITHPLPFSLDSYYSAKQEKLVGLIEQLETNVNFIELSEKYGTEYNCGNCKHGSEDRDLAGGKTGLFCCWYSANRDGIKGRPPDGKYLPHKCCENWEPGKNFYRKEDKV